MIVEYLRPKTVDEALSLLARKEPRTIPAGGGSTINRSGPERLAVVDLQSLPLKEIHRQGNFLEVGATVTLQSLLDSPDIPPALKEAIRLEATHNLRQVATVAGALVAAGGRSPFATALLALDASLKLLCGQPAVESSLSLGDLLPSRSERLAGALITQIKLPLNAGFCYTYVARTPADQPIVCAAAAQWPGRRTRLALGGYGTAPILAMDGPEPSGAEIAAASAYASAGDQWASAEYRSETAAVLARRCLENFKR